MAMELEGIISWLRQKGVNAFLIDGKTKGKDPSGIALEVQIHNLYLKYL